MIKIETNKNHHFVIKELDIDAFIYNENNGKDDLNWEEIKKELEKNFIYEFNLKTMADFCYKRIVKIYKGDSNKYYQFEKFSWDKLPFHRIISNVTGKIYSFIKNIIEENNEIELSFFKKKK